MLAFILLTVSLCRGSAAVLTVSETAKTQNTTYILTPGEPKIISLKSNDVAVFSVVDIESTSGFLVIQVVTQHVALNLTQPSPSPAVSISGNSVGMVRELGSSVSSVYWTVQLINSTESGSVSPVSLLAVVQEYSQNAPVPGACNQVFQLETDPNILLDSAAYHTQVWFQWASVAYSGSNPPCEIKMDSSRLSYDVYVSYVAKNDHGDNALFDAVRSMMSVDSIRNQQKILTIHEGKGKKSLTTVTAQRAQGAVYGIVVTDSQYGLSASYVSAVTYACNFTAGDCSLKYDAIEWVMIFACGIVGLILLILGHQYLKTEMAVIGFVGTTMVCFLLLLLPGTVSESAALLIAAALGLIGGVLWLLLWMKFMFPTMSVLLPGLCAGYLVAASIFFSPFANISWWDYSLNYGLVFTCFTLIFVVLLMVFKCRTLNIVSCSLVGGYCVVMVIGIPMRSSLRLIVLNGVHHASVPGYSSVHVISPFQTDDIILTVVWAVLLIFGTAWQFYRARGMPNFPTRARRQYRPRAAQNPRIRDGIIPSPDVDENSPLLGQQESPPAYVESERDQPQNHAEMRQPL